MKYILTSLLLITYLACLSSNNILSMLLFLVAAYLISSIWFISHGIVYAGLLYILVYVGAIVVLIIFVVQLTNTSLSSYSSYSKGTLLSLILLFSALIILSAIPHLTATGSLLINLTNFNLIDNSVLSLVNNSSGELLTYLGSSIFNEYGYILIISIHAIILAVIGPIKLALLDYNPITTITKTTSGKRYYSTNKPDIEPNKGRADKDYLRYVLTKPQLKLVEEPIHDVPKTEFYSVSGVIKTFFIIFNLIVVWSFAFGWTPKIDSTYVENIRLFSLVYGLTNIVRLANGFLFKPYFINYTSPYLMNPFLLSANIPKFWWWIPLRILILSVVFYLIKLNNDYLNSLHWATPHLLIGISILTSFVYNNSYLKAWYATNKLQLVPKVLPRSIFLIRHHIIYSFFEISGMLCTLITCRLVFKYNSNLDEGIGPFLFYYSCLWQIITLIMIGISILYLLYKFWITPRRDTYYAVTVENAHLFALYNSYDINNHTDENFEQVVDQEIQNIQKLHRTNNPLGFNRTGFNKINRRNFSSLPTRVIANNVNIKRNFSVNRVNLGRIRQILNTLRLRRLTPINRNQILNHAVVNHPLSPIRMGTETVTNYYNMVRIRFNTNRFEHNSGYEEFIQENFKMLLRQLYGSFLLFGIAYGSYESGLIERYELFYNRLVANFTEITMRFTYNIAILEDWEIPTHALIDGDLMINRSQNYIDGLRNLDQNNLHPLELYYDYLRSWINGFEINVNSNRENHIIRHNHLNFPPNLFQALGQFREIDHQFNLITERYVSIDWKRVPRFSTEELEILVDHIRTELRLSSSVNLPVEYRNIINLLELLEDHLNNLIKEGFSMKHNMDHSLIREWLEQDSNPMIIDLEKLTLNEATLREFNGDIRSIDQLINAPSELQLVQATINNPVASTTHSDNPIASTSRNIINDSNNSSQTLTIVTDQTTNPSSSSDHDWDSAGAGQRLNEQPHGDKPNELRRLDKGKGKAN